MRLRALSPALLLLLAACAGQQRSVETDPQPTPATTLTVNGEVQLKGDDFRYNSDTMTCAGKGGYEDLTPGAQVVVTDEAGAVIGSGQIVTGSTRVVDEQYQLKACVLTFTVDDVPAGKKFYGVEVTHRGRLQYTEHDLQQTIQMSI